MSSLFDYASHLKSDLQNLFDQMIPDAQIQKQGLDVRINFTYRKDLLPEFVGYVQFSEKSMVAHFAPLAEMDITQEQIERVLANFCQQHSIKRLDVNFTPANISDLKAA